MFEPEEEWMYSSVGETASAERGVLRAGRPVPAGRYLRIDVPWGGIVALDQDAWLPASFDGKVALYVRINDPISFPGDLKEWKRNGSAA